MNRMIFQMALLAVFVIACSTKKEETSSPPPAQTSLAASQTPQAVEPNASASSSKTAPEAKGLQLIESSDCLSCHTTERKMVGPSYRDIAQKYTATDLPSLVQHIRDGSVGIWGQLPMSAHADLSVEDATLMATYILSQKK